jgi:hypothetical protein
MTMYQWIVFAHVVSAFTFFIAHGVAIAVALRVRHERQVERLQVLLELSNLSRPTSNVSLIILLLSGIAGGFMADWWRMGWIWVSLVLLVLMSIGMRHGMSPYFNSLRKAVGSPYVEASKRQVAGEPVCAEEIKALLASARMEIPAAIGIGIMVVILYLMMFKPF